MKYRDKLETYEVMTLAYDEKEAEKIREKREKMFKEAERDQWGNIIDEDETLSE